VTLAGLAAPRGRPRRDARDDRIARLEQEKRQLEQELAKARFVVEVQAKLYALLETISRASSPSPGRRRDRRGDRRAGAHHRHPSSVPRRGCCAGRLLPAPPPQSRAAAADADPHRDRSQPRALTAPERHTILDALHGERFVDVAPVQVWATLLDEGVYLGSISTFYRLLRQAGETREPVPRPVRYLARRRFGAGSSAS
jgi:hypothetical protein